MIRLLFKLLRYLGLPFIFREFIQRDKVTILLFHDISAANAQKTFLYLHKNYNIISLNNFITACQENKKNLIPPKALVITFDDGLMRNYELLPVIKKLKIPITIFLCSGIINTSRHYWFTFKHPEINTDSFKKMRNKEKLNILAEIGFSLEKEFDFPQAMTKSQILEMRETVDFQAHTVFHPCLPTCDTQEATIEIQDCKKNLEAEYGLKINALAYPNGDYSERDIKISQESGFTCALTCDTGFNTIYSDLFRLKRLSVNDTENMDELVVKSSGLWAFIRPRNGKMQPLVS